MRQFVRVRLSSSLWAREDPKPWVVILMDDGYAPQTRARSLGRFASAELANEVARYEAGKRGVEAKLAAENPDVRERELERAVAQGDVDAEAALIRHRIRNSTLFKEQVQLLADLGDPAAVKAIGITATDLPLFSAQRIRDAGPMYAALLMLVTVRETMRWHMHRRPLRTAVFEYQSRQDREMGAALAWLDRVNMMTSDWLKGERPPEGEERYAGERWVNLWTDTPHYPGLATAISVVMAMNALSVWPEPDRRNFSPRSWPEFAEDAITKLSQLPGSPAVPFQKRVLEVVKPWVWNKGPSKWIVPRQNPQLALVGNPPPPWVEIITSQPGRSDLYVEARDIRGQRPKRAGFLHVSLRRSWDPRKDLWGRPPVPVATVANIIVKKDYLRQGIGTALYEAAAKHVAGLGFHLASDTSLSKMSGGFWRKQVKKGRARRVSQQRSSGRRYHRYVLDPADPQTLENPQPKIPQRWDPWQDSISESQWVEIWKRAGTNRKAAYEELRQLYWRWLSSGRGMRPRLFGEQELPPGPPLPPKMPRVGPHDWELGQNPGFEEGKLGFSGKEFYVPRDARERLDWLANQYRLLSAELDERIADGREVGDLEQHVEELAELLEAAAQDLETGEHDLRYGEVHPGLEEELAKLYHEYLFPAHPSSDRFVPYYGAPYTTREGGLASVARHVLASAAYKHGARSLHPEWEPLEFTDEQAIAAAKDAYHRAVHLRGRLGGKKAPWSMTPAELREWVRRRQRNPCTS